MRSDDVPHHRQVVRDEQVRQVELVLEVLEQVEDLGLDRHVERRHRLVADDQLRAERERPGDADALALAAGELVRVPVVVLRVQPDELHELAGPRRLIVFFGTVLWIRNGSPMICPTVCRGFSDAYGSWKIICISRRSGRSSPAESFVMSWPSK